MTDIFDQTILCEKCGEKMKKNLIEKNRFKLRTIECSKCNSRIIHPQDLAEYKNFMNLKRKNYKVKLRIIGNSYAVSIPKEIVDFMHEQEKKMKEMVNLCFEEMGRLSLRFD